MAFPADRFSSGQQHESSQRGRTGIVGDEEVGNTSRSPPLGKPISYWTFLANPQMAVLCFLRIAGQLATLSLLSYLPFQLRYLSPAASDEDLALHAGILVGAKTLAKVLTGIFWGLAADAHGRKTALLIGLVGSAIGNAGYGFSTTFHTALAWQVVQGAASSEIALTRTIAAELYAKADVRNRSRALLLPLLVSGIGMILGPVLGGFASNRSGLGLLSHHPYALPNLIVALWYALSALLVLFILQETLQPQSSPARRTRNGVLAAVQLLLGRTCGRGTGPTYREVPQEEDIPMTAQDQTEEEPTTPHKLRVQQKSSIRQIWTAEVVTVMTAHFLITGHISTFGTVYTIFLSTPIDAFDQATVKQDGGFLSRRDHSPFLINGGLGLTSPQIGTFFTSATVLFALLQGLVFPRLVQRTGTIRLWRAVLFVFPAIYFLAPVPNLLATESQATVLTWTAISFIMVVYMAAQALVMPPMVIFISECVPHPGVRGLVNAVGTTVGNLARSVFPVLVMFVYGLGLNYGVLFGAFWLLSGIAGVAIIASRWVGSGLDPTITLKRSADAGE